MIVLQSLIKNYIKMLNLVVSILVNDGQVELLVDHVEGEDIVCVCANDGVV